MKDFYGALPKKLDLRDKQWHKLATASAPFDWDVGYDVGDLVIKDQNGSGSCGGQAGSYLCEVVRRIPCSARYIYSQIFYPQGGTTARDLGNILVKKGDCLETLVPSYNQGQTPDESFMRDTTLDSGADTDALKAKGLSYAFIQPDINLYAQAIRDNGGCIMEIEGQNGNHPSWRDTTPKPPNPIHNSNDIWRHFLFCSGAKLISGKKFIVVHNSWGSNCGDNGKQYISEDYFKSGYIDEGLVIYEPTSAIIQEKITLMTNLVALLQKLINLLSGPTKKIVM